jgi:transcriptional regulator GlxA family with amidase domain
LGDPVKRRTLAEHSADRRKARDEDVDKARAAVDADPSADHSMPALARTAFMSRWYFLRSFAVRYGMPPSEYVTRARFNLMCVLLETTNRKIGEVTRAVGFKGIGIASTNFRRRIGCSPTDYRMWAAYARELGQPTQP